MPTLFGLNFLTKPSRYMALCAISGGWLTGLVSCEFVGKLCMLSHPHRSGFCIQPCTACGENLSAHIETEVEKQYIIRKQNASQPVFWHPANRKTPNKERRPRKSKICQLFISRSRIFCFWLSACILCLNQPATQIRRKI